MRAGWAAVAAALAVGALAATTAPEAARRAATVVIDPGHDRQGNPTTEPVGPGSTTTKIKDGGGTRGVVTGIAEADLVLDVSKRLRVLLERAGTRIVMTRTRTEGASMGNIARARIANRAQAVLFLRVHADGHSDSTVRGTHILVPALRAGWTDDIHAESRRAAEAILPELVQLLGFPSRGISEHPDFTGFNWSNVPVVLVELGFMTNPTEDRALARPTVRQRAAVGLCRGVQRMLGREPGACLRRT